MEKANRKTPLYDAHVKAGGKIIDFHGWLLPVQYSSILKEHENVRTKAGLFDVSHMGEIEVSGSDAFTFLQKMLTNDITAKPGRAIYSPMCLPDGVLLMTLLSISKSTRLFASGKCIEHRQGFTMASGKQDWRCRYKRPL